MHPKFIRIKGSIYSIRLLDQAYHLPIGETVFRIADKTFRYKNSGFMWSGFNCFIENLNCDEMDWRSCFDVEHYIQEGKDIDEMHKDACAMAKL